MRVSPIIKIASCALADILASSGLVVALLEPAWTYAGTDSASCLLIEDGRCIRVLLRPARIHSKRVGVGHLFQNMARVLNGQL